jgi:CDP-paratose 2-epimerase
MSVRVMVTGGAGFVGSHLVDSLVRDGYQVRVFDALVRPGSRINLDWLRDRYPDDRLQFVHGDVSESRSVLSAVRDVDVIYHLAGQVAVTTSVADPRTDFVTNALGTLNVLEAARRSGRRPPIVFTSTNKVYGGMESMELEKDEDRYRYRHEAFGIPETQPLDFHSPYGCSKGAADQYVRDYSRIYRLPTVVFRMSCIYGPRQYGTEDQGWLAHFIIAAVTDKPITIYGDGKQVRDVLYVSDLIQAFRLAVNRIDKAAGQVFNIGGGPTNTLSVWNEFGQILTALKGVTVPVQFEAWRPGDQPCYVSDIRKAAAYLGWRPEVDKVKGIRRLWKWVVSNEKLFRKLQGESRISA